MRSILSNLVLLIVTFCSGGLAGYLFREQMSRSGIGGLSVIDTIWTRI
jgi:hypothetical protein